MQGMSRPNVRIEVKRNPTRDQEADLLGAEVVTTEAEDRRAAPAEAAVPTHIDVTATVMEELTAGGVLQSAHLSDGTVQTPEIARRGTPETIVIVAGTGIVESATTARGSAVPAPVGAHRAECSVRAVRVAAGASALPVDLADLLAAILNQQAMSAPVVERDRSAVLVQRAERLGEALVQVPARLAAPTE